MAELKKIFIKGKMNKDLDERLVPNGEYRDANNVQVSTSDADDAGTVQSVLGNKKSSNDQDYKASLFNHISESNVVGSVVDEANNYIYYFVRDYAEPIPGKHKDDVNYPDAFQTQLIGTQVDAIIRYDQNLNTTTEVLLDAWRVFAKLDDPNGAGVSASDEEIYVRRGLTNGSDPYNVHGLDIAEGMIVSLMDSSGANILATPYAVVQDIVVDSSDATTGETISKITLSRPIDHSDSISYTQQQINEQGITVVFTSPQRILNFQKRDKEKSFITSINIIDDFLLWTDDIGEPKKINVKASLAGTNNKRHTFRVKLTNTGGYTQSGGRLEHDDVTVIRKNPTIAPIVIASSTADDTQDAYHLLSQSVDAETGVVTGINILNTTNVGDNIVFQIVGGTTLNADTVISFQGAISQYKFYGTVQSSDAETGVISVKISSLPSAVGGVEYADYTTVQETYNAFIFEESSMYQDKFIRFAYRYRYIDGEYSGISPFSETLFFPNTYSYTSDSGKNLAMQNITRSVKIQGFVPPSTPQSVDSVDILMKDSTSPSIYKIRNFKRSDGEFSTTAYGEVKGSFTLKSEVYGSTIPSDQILRSWDAVPKRAKSQEISSNRLIYANYLQNYNLTDAEGRNVSLQMQPKISLSPQGFSSILQVTDNLFSNYLYQKSEFVIDPINFIVATPGNTGSFDVFDNGNNMQSLPMYTMGQTQGYSIDGRVYDGSAGEQAVDATIYKIKSHYFTDTNTTRILTGEYRFSSRVVCNTFIHLGSGLSNSASNFGSAIPSNNNTISADDPRQFGIPEARIELVYLSINVEQQKIGIAVGKGNNGVVVDDNGNEVASAWGPAGKYWNRASIFVNGTHSPNSAPEDYITGSLGFTHGNQDGELGIFNLPDVPVTVTHDDPDNSRNLDPGSNAVYGFGVRLVFSGKMFYVDEANYEVTNDNGGKRYNVTSDYITSRRNYGGDIGIREGFLIFTDNTSSAIEFKLEGGEDVFGYNTREHKDTVITNASLPSTTLFRSFNKNVHQYDSDTGATDSGYKFVNQNGPPAGSSNNNNFTFARIQDSKNSTLSTYFKVTKAPSLSLGTTTGFGQPSIKSDRKYELGVVYRDVQGRESTVLLGEASEFSVEKSYSTSVINIMPIINSKAPYWADSYKFFVKENSLDYYNLVADNTFLADEAGTNIWISFNSIDRNKISDETVLVLKKRHNVVNDSSAALVGTADNVSCEYQVLDISNEAPQYVKDSVTIANENWSNGRFFVKVKNDSLLKIAFANTTFNLGQTIQNDTQAFYVHNHPAVFETKASKESSADTFFEASQAFPVRLTNKNVHEYIRQGSTITGFNVDALGNAYAMSDLVADRPEGYPSDNPSSVLNGTVKVVNVELDSYSTQRFSQSELKSQTKEMIKITVDTPLTLQAITPATDTDNFERSCVHLVFKHPNVFGSTSARVVKYLTHENTSTIYLNPLTHPVPQDKNATSFITIPFYNCYSFGNGVESDRIIDGFNNPTLFVETQSGDKASLVLEDYREEHRNHGLIHSEIYNSTTSINKLNQFIAAKSITKDLSPEYGSIQKIYSRDTNIIVFCEDKVLNVLGKKVALLSADGNTNLGLTESIFGTEIPYQGEFGISKNPESFATSDFRIYFTDKARKAVLRLSKDGITRISDAGMSDWFNDNMGSAKNIIGSFDKRKNEYNLTLLGPLESLSDSYTLSFNETSDGWVSFKSFLQKNGQTLNSEYYTFSNGEIWKHHSTTSAANNFYGTQYYSDITVIFNEQPSLVKSFKTINYEGSDSRVKLQASDDQYYNNNSKKGWYVESFKTDQQEGSVPEFINKEGKWFNYIQGDATTLDNIDFKEANIQGLGSLSINSSVTGVGGSQDITYYQGFTLTGETLVVDSAGQSLEAVSSSSFTVQNVTPAIIQTCTTTNASNEITLAEASPQIFIGTSVEGTNIPLNTVVETISGTTVTLNNNATGTGNVELSFVQNPADSTFTITPLPNYTIQASDFYFGTGTSSASSGTTFTSNVNGVQIEEEFNEELWEQESGGFSINIPGSESKWTAYATNQVAIVADPEGGEPFVRLLETNISGNSAYTLLRASSLTSGSLTSNLVSGQNYILTFDAKVGEYTHTDGQVYQPNVVGVLNPNITNVSNLVVTGSISSTLSSFSISFTAGSSAPLLQWQQMNKFDTGEVVYMRNFSLKTTKNRIKSITFTDTATPLELNNTVLATIDFNSVSLDANETIQIKPKGLVYTETVEINFSLDLEFSGTAGAGQTITIFSGSGSTGGQLTPGLLNTGTNLTVQEVDEEIRYSIDNFINV